MNQEKYLQNDSCEAIEMRQKVKDLFHSKDTANAELAYQLIKGGGMHQDFVPVLWATYIDSQPTNVKREIGKLLKKQLPQEAYTLFNQSTTRFLETYLYDYESWEDWADYVLQAVGENLHTAPMQSELALSLMLVMKIGGRYALTHRLMPESKILHLLLDEKGDLSLKNYHLLELPTALADMPTIRLLDIRWNSLSKYNEQLKDMHNLPLDTIRIDNNLPEPIMDGITRLYPDAMGKYYKQCGYSLASKSKNFQRDANFEDCVKISTQALNLLDKVPEKLQDTSYWFSVALASLNARQYEKSIIAGNKATSREPNFSGGVVFYNLACAYAHLNNKEAMLENLKQAYQYQSYYCWYEEAKINNDFIAYWKDADFIELTKTP